jgi:hypothetical protein
MANHALGAKAPLNSSIGTAAMATEMFTNYERVRRRLLELRASGDLMHLSVMRDGERNELTAGFEP